MDDLNNKTLFIYKPKQIPFKFSTAVCQSLHSVSLFQTEITVLLAFLKKVYILGQVQLD